MINTSGLNLLGFSCEFLLITCGFDQILVKAHGNLLESANVAKSDITNYSQQTRTNFFLIKGCIQVQ